MNLETVPGRVTNTSGVTTTAALRLHPDAYVALRVRSLGRTPERIVADALALGLDAIALADRCDLSNLVPTIEEGARHGLCVVPAVEVPTRTGPLVGYFVDHQDPEVLRLVEHAREAPPSTAEAAAVLRCAGAVMARECDVPARNDGRAVAALLARAAARRAGRPHVV